MAHQQVMSLCDSCLADISKLLVQRPVWLVATPLLSVG